MKDETKTMQSHLQTKVGIEVEVEAEAEAELSNMTASTDPMKQRGATVSMVILPLVYCVVKTV